MKERADKVVSQRFRLRHTHFTKAEAALVEAYPDNPEVHVGGLKMALRALGWEIETDQSGSIIELSLVRRRALELPIFAGLGPYVEAGSCIDFTNEEGDRWRWYFDGTHAHHQEGRVVYTDAPEAPESLPPDRISEMAPAPREWLRQAGSLGPDEETKVCCTTLRTMAEHAEMATLRYAALTGLDFEVDEEAALKDLLTSLMHLCDRDDLDFEELLATAQNHYDAEINGES